MRPFLVLRVLVFLLGLLLASSRAFGQEDLPQLDVVILVDVSESVTLSGKWEKKHQQIVKSLIKGDLRESDYERDWTLTDWQSPSLGEKPLTGAGHSVLLMPFGGYDFTRSSSEKAQPEKMDRWPRDFDDYFDSNYPATFGQNMTHCLFSQALAYDKSDSAAGYYLVLVSDELDDIRDLPGEHYDQQDQEKIDNFVRASDKKVLAGFTRKGTSLKITLRKVERKKTAPSVPDPVPVVTTTETLLDIKWLGDLNGSTAESPYRSSSRLPYFAWQVNNLSQSKGVPAFSVFLNNAQIASDVGEMKYAYEMSGRGPLASGSYSVHVVSGASKSPLGYIKIEPARDYLMPVVMISGLLSLGIFFYTSWILRR